MIQSTKSTKLVMRKKTEIIAEIAQGYEGNKKIVETISK